MSKKIGREPCGKCARPESPQHAGGDIYHARWEWRQTPNGKVYVKRTNQSDAAKQAQAAYRRRCKVPGCNIEKRTRRFSPFGYFCPTHFKKVKEFFQSLIT